MKYSCLIITTAHPAKLNWLQQVLERIDKQNFFDDKVLCIDEFDNNYFPEELKNKFISNGWNLVVDNHKSRTLSMLNGLKICKHDYIFYSEDDVVVKFPEKQFIDDLLNTTIKDRKCGMVSLTFGGSTSDFPNNTYGDLLESKHNILKTHNKYFAFLRLEKYKNAWFFEFPALFMPKKLFTQCIEGARVYGGQIEQALTLDWFNTGKDIQYFKCSIARNNFFYYLENDISNLFKKSRLLINLDVHQGSFIYGGNPNI